MFNFLKIYISLLICFVLVFRLFSVNASLVSSVKYSQKNNISSIRTSYVLNKYGFETSGFSSTGNGKEYRLFEACAEDFQGKTELIKPNLPVILSFFFSFLSPDSVCVKWHPSFDHIKSELYPKKYLSISILRI